MSDRKLSPTQVEALCSLRQAGITRDREGVSVATAGALKARGLVLVHPVFREELNFVTGRVSRRAGWIMDVTGDGAEIADAVLSAIDAGDAEDVPQATAWLGR
jgi:hypothetical protein